MALQDKNDLSERELEILRLVATGASNKEIAHKLVISPNTVKVHLRNIFAKIGAASRTEAAMYAVRIGLVLSGQTVIEDHFEELYVNINDSLIPATVVIKDQLSFLDWVRKQWLVFTIIFLILFGLAAIFQIIPNLNVAETVSLTFPQDSPSLSTESRWRRLADLPTPRGGLAVVVNRGQIFAIGGESAQGISGKVEVLDPIKNKWETLPEKPIPVSDIQGAVIGGKIFIPGGKTQSGLPTAVVEFFDPQTLTWEKGESLPIPLSAYALVTFDGNLILFGGWDGNTYLSNVFLYRVDANQWSELPSLPANTGYAGAAVIDRQILILGGFDGKNKLDSLIVYEPDLALGLQTEYPYTISHVGTQGERYASAITNIADALFILGGEGTSNNNRALVFIPSMEEWQTVEPPPMLSDKQMGIVSIGTDIFSLGGFAANKPSAEVYTYKVFYTLNIPYAPDGK